MDPWICIELFPRVLACSLSYRMWGKEDNVSECFTIAKQEAMRVLSLFANVKLDGAEGGAVVKEVNPLSFRFRGVLYTRCRITFYVDVFII